MNAEQGNYQQALRIVEAATAETNAVKEQLKRLEQQLEAYKRTDQLGLATDLLRAIAERDHYKFKAEGRDVSYWKTVAETAQKQLAAEQAKHQQTSAERSSLKMSVEIIRKNRDEWERSWGQVVRERDAAIARAEEAEAKLFEQSQRFAVAESAAYDRGRQHELTEGNWLEIESQLSTLRKAVEEAPHSRECIVNVAKARGLTGLGYECDCWKSRALNAEGGR